MPKHTKTETQVRNPNLNRERDPRVSEILGVALDVLNHKFEQGRNVVGLGELAEMIGGKPDMFHGCTRTGVGRILEAVLLNTSDDHLALILIRARQLKVDWAKADRENMKVASAAMRTALGHSAVAS